MRLFASALALLAAAGTIHANQNFAQRHEPLQEWDLDKKPDADSTGRFIFDNLASLLQRWTNSRYQTGHSIVPGIVATDTLLYHCRKNSSLPDGPQWVATDPEHALLFCRETSWLLTLVSTRPLKIMYFDGTSATLVPGAWDSQDIVLHGEVMDTSFEGIYRRISDFCEWGQEFALDGFVRMAVDFEIMLCNFTEGVEVVSRLDVPTNFFLYDLHRPEITAEILEAINSGSRHNNFPGETRVQLDAARLVSFYDSALTPSLVEPRSHQERWLHRLYNLTKADARAYVARLKDILRLGPELKSGIDWEKLARVIVDRYGERLELLRYAVSDTSGRQDGNLTAQARRAHDKLRLMMQPYISRSAIPANLSSIADTDDISWATPMYKNCATAHTFSIAKRADKLLPSEQTLLSAVRETTGEICRVTARMWAQGVNAGLDRVLGPLVSTEPSTDGLKDLILKWKVDVTALMGWLDWSMWVKCDPPCGFEELCYMPSLPFLRSAQKSRLSPIRKYDRVWKNSQPHCIRRLEPYSLF